MKNCNNNPEPKTKEIILYISLIHLAVDMLQRQYDGMYEGCAERGGQEPGR